MHPGTPKVERRWLFSFHWLGACRNYVPGAEKRVAVLLLFLGAGMMPVQLRAGPPGIFEETGSLVNPSQFQWPALLPNGKVLVGGQLYDPASGTWTATGGGSTVFGA